MIIADSNVLIDILGSDPVWSDWSRRKLDDALAVGIRINQPIYAEIAPQFAQQDLLDVFLSASQIRLLETSRTHLFLAGKTHQRYRASGGERRRVLADFMIGAQAALDHHAILTRDPKIFRAYFPNVELITP